MRKKQDFEDFYLTDKYVAKHPSLHIEHSLWKIELIHPLLERYMTYFTQNSKEKTLNILDVGGGAGLILSETAREIEQKYNIKSNKIALDLSPNALEIQKKMNPDLKKALNEDICKTSLKTKEIDLTLMIDVLEHIPNPVNALKEVKRISNFVILKVPLEDTILYKVWDLITGGKNRQYLIETFGHINVYNYCQLAHQIEKNMGQIVSYHYTNVFKHSLPNVGDLRNNLINRIASYTFSLSPSICSLIFRDFVMMLVKCYP